jgi:hypothetical protein
VKKKLTREVQERFSAVLLLYYKMLDYVILLVVVITFNQLAQSVGKNVNQEPMIVEHSAPVRVDVLHFSKI